MKFCTKCGAKISDNDAKFCGNCGAKIFNETFETETEQNTKPQSESIQEIFKQAKATVEVKKVPAKNATLEALVRAKQIKNAIEISKNQSESTEKNTNSQDTTNQTVGLWLSGIIIAIFL